MSERQDMDELFIAGSCNRTFERAIGTLATATGTNRQQTQGETPMKRFLAPIIGMLCMCFAVVATTAPPALAGGFCTPPLDHMEQVRVLHPSAQVEHLWGSNAQVFLADFNASPPQSWFSADELVLAFHTGSNEADMALARQGCVRVTVPTRADLVRSLLDHNIPPPV